jgi:carboxylesterase type B
MLRAEGAAHGLELFEVFQKLDSEPAYQATPADQALEATMLGYWTRLAGGHDPNGGASVAWPRWTTNDDYLQLDEPAVARDHLRSAKCDFWLGL